MTTKLVKLIPFLVVDGTIILAIFLLMQLDWLVNNTFYNYGLTFSSDWAMPYWTALRIILGSLSFTLISITIIGFSSYKKAREETANTVFFCKSCGHAFTELKGHVNVTKTLPKFKVLKECPSCSKKLLENRN